MLKKITIFFVGLALAGVWIVGCAKPAGQGEFEAGLKDIRRGNYVRAKTLLEKSIRLRPGSEQNAIAYHYLGIASWNLGQYQAAMESFEDSRRISPSLMEPVYNLGVLVADTDVPRAIKLFEDAARTDTTDARPLEYMGHLYTAREQWPEARRAYYAALDRAPESARIWTAIALVDLQVDGPDKAIDSLMNALEKDVKYAPALFDLAVIYQTRMQNGDQAEAYYRKFLNVATNEIYIGYATNALRLLSANVLTEPDTSTTSATGAQTSATSRETSTADDQLKDAAQWAAKGQTKKAMDICLRVARDAAASRKTDLQEKALRTAVKLCFDESQAHVELGRFLLEHGKADAALKVFKQAIVLDRDNAEAHLGMAQAAMQTGEYDAAVVGLKDAVKADPKNADALWTLATLYDQQLDVPESALGAYREFEKQFPADPRVVKARERIKAIAPSSGTSVSKVVSSASATPPSAPSRRIQYKKPSVRNTKDAVSAFNRGAVYQQQKNWDQALYYYTRAIENDDLLTSAFFNMGIVYSSKGDYDLAKDAYLHALELQPSLVNARYNLALIYRETKDRNAAIQMLTEVVKASPDHAQANYALGLLYSEKNETVPLAKKHYQRYLELAPQDPAARAVRQWVEAN